MKKLLILVAALLMVSSVFAQSGGRLFVQPNASNFPGGGNASTTDNDDTCDIGVAPAATLLLPWFEVGLGDDQTTAVNTVFTLTNVSAQPAIAHVVVWTDWSYPVLDFNIWLTGYDVQGISLYDIITLGNIPPTGADDDDNSPIGDFSESTNENHTWDSDPLNDCSDLPGPIPATLLAEVQDALTDGEYFGDTVGGEHENAVGYLTVDVAARCSTALPGASSYFESEALFDNTLIGDYQRINPDATSGNYAGGNPMVHIRAVPEGGPADSDPGTNLPWTFYDRYLDDSGDIGLDRRQPLPGVWAARYLEDEEGVQEFETRFQIWREGFNDGATDSLADDNDAIPVGEMVRFDEHENPFVQESEICQISPCPDPEELEITFPETSNYLVSDASHFPPDPDSDDLGGWMYMNLNSGLGTVSTGATRPIRVESQNWVTIQMTAEGRYGVDFDAAWLGNGCSLNPEDHVNADGDCEDGPDDECGIGPLDNLQDNDCPYCTP
jgi:hypothetical protein